MRAPKTADFIVIGTGVIGSSIAFHLMKRNAGRVLILDKNLAAQGGSSRSSALVRMHYTLPEEVQLAVKSYEIFTHIGASFRRIAIGYFLGCTLGLVLGVIMGVTQLTRDMLTQQPDTAISQA